MTRDGNKYNPFTGLNPIFDHFPSQNFFGRDKDIYQTVNLLEAKKMVVLSGHAGNGKTSFIHSGLIPRLKHKSENLGYEWVIITFTPGKNIIKNFASVLAQKGLIHDEKDFEDIYAFTFEENLKINQEGLLKILKQSPLIRGKKILFIIDQLENIFKSNEEVSYSQKLADLEDFISLFKALYETKDFPAYTIFSIQTQFLNYIQNSSLTSFFVNTGFYQLPAFTSHDTFTIILKQFDISNISVNQDLKQKLKNQIIDLQPNIGITQEIMQLFVDKFAKNPEPLSIDKFHKLGEFYNTIDLNAELYYQENEEFGLGRVTEKVFRSLINAKYPEQPYSRILSIAELAAITNEDVDNIIYITDIFAGWQPGILTIVSDDQIINKTSLVKITNENIIFYWQRLKQWYEKEYESIRLYLRLVRYAKLYDKGYTELYRNYNLHQALEWETTEKPTNAWAQLYDQNYKLAFNYLDKSREQYEREQNRTKQSERSKRLKTALKIGLGVFIFGLVALSYVLYKYYQVKNEKIEIKHANKTSVSNNILHSANAIMNTDPTKAFRLVQWAQKVDTNKQVNNILRSIYSGNNFYEIIANYPDEVNAVEVAPNENYFIAASGKNAYMTNFKGEKLHVFERHSGKINALDISHNGTYFITASDDGTCRLWNFSGKEIAQFSKKLSPVYDCCFSPDDEHILTASKNGKLILWNLQGEPLEIINNEGIPFINVDFNPNGKSFAAISQHHKIHFYNLNGREIQQTLEAKHKKFNIVSYSPSGKYIFTGGKYKFFQWSTEGKLINTFSGHKNFANDLCYIKNKRKIISAFSDHSMRLWNLSGIEIQKYLGHNREVQSIDVFNDGNSMISGSKDNTVRLWNIKGNKVNALVGHTEDVSTVAFSPKGTHIVSGSNDDSLRILNLVTNKEIFLNPEGGDILDINFIGNTDEFLSSNEAGIVHKWNKHGKLLEKFQVHTEAVSSIAISPDEKYFLSGSQDSTAKLWDFNGNLIQSFKGHKGGVLDVEFLPTGERLVTCSEDNTARMWDIEGNILNNFEGHKARVTDVSISPGGKYVATASWDNSAILWDISGNIITKYNGHDSYVNSVAFSYHGDKIVTTSFDNSAKIWNLSGTEIQSLKGHSNFVLDAVFSPDDSYVLTGAADNTVRIWEIITNKNNYLNNTYIEELSPHELYKYNLLSFEDLIKKSSRDQLIEAGEYFVEKSRTYSNFKEKIRWLKKARDTYEKAFELYHKESYQNKIAYLYAEITRYYMYNKNYRAAYESLNKGMNRFRKNKDIKRIEPLVYLMNNETRIATDIYAQRKDKMYKNNITYRDIFLLDIKSLKQKDIHHNTFGEIKEILR